MPPRITRAPTASHEQTARSASHSEAEERGARRKDAGPAVPRPPRFGGQHDRDGACGERAPTAGRREDRDRRQHRELKGEAPRPRELVVRLAHALRPEVMRGRRSPQHEEIVEPRLTAAGGDDRAHQFQVLEHGAAVIAAGRNQDAATHRDRSGPVAPRHSIQKDTARIPARVPRERIEIVLRADDLGGVERCREAVQRRLVIPHVVVRDNHARVRCQPQAGEHAADLAHLGREVRRRRDVTQTGADARQPRPRRAPRRSRRAIRQRRWSPRGRSASAGTPPVHRTVQLPPIGSA